MLAARDLRGRHRDCIGKVGKVFTRKAHLEGLKSHDDMAAGKSVSARDLTLRKKFSLRGLRVKMAMIFHSGRIQGRLDRST